MPAVYVKDYAAELRRVGDVVFKGRYRSPFLIVTGRAAELVDEPAGRDKTVLSAPSPDGAKETAIINRVFPVTKAQHAPRGPIVLGRSGENDVAIPEYSISRRQCFFEFEPEGITVTDCGSTNGTLLGGSRLEPGEPTLIRDGMSITFGRFAFVFRTAVGFHGFIKSLNQQ